MNPKLVSKKTLKNHSVLENSRKLTIREKINVSDSEDSDDSDLKPSFWIILPDTLFKRTWDFYIAFLLVYSAIVTPYLIAFHDNELFAFNIIEYYINSSFFLDLIFNFFSAYYDNMDNLVVSHRKLILKYMKSWFLIDLLSVIPIDNFLNSSSNTNISSAIGKVARIPKIYRLIKLTKLVRMVKIKKGSVNNLTKYFFEKLKVSPNIEKLIYFIFGFLILNHLSACFWYLVAKLEDLSPDSWVTRLGYTDYESFDIYVVAFYWSLTTVTTVGYGDIVAFTTFEKIYNLFIMSFGVVMYSFAIGSLSSIVSSLDSKTAEMNQRLQILHSIRSEFKLNDEIYHKVRKIIKFELSKNQKDKIDFLQELPNKLRIELSQIINDNVIKKLYFFRQASPDFIAYVTPLLKPVKYSQNEVLYKIGDIMDESKYLIFKKLKFEKLILVYFVYKGAISFKLSENYGSKEIKIIKKSIFY